MLSSVLAAALAAMAPQSAATQPAGPPGATPLQRQSGAPEQAPRPGQGSAGAKSAGPDTAAAQPGPAPGQPASGLVSYPASFFAAAQPNTARDMLDRLPGFVFNGGSDVRGLAGAAGNVLIDGLRPSSKSDDLESIVRRIPTSQVERIDLIRGGAPGIDMQGKSVLANIVRRRTASTTGLISIVNQANLRDGRNSPGIRLETSRSQNGRVLEGSFVTSKFQDDGAGTGTRVLRDPAGRVIALAGDDSKADGQQTVATLAYERPLFGGKLKLNAQGFNQTYQFKEDVDPTSGDGIGRQSERDHQNKTRGEFGLHYNRDFGPKVALETILLQQVADEDYTALFNQPGEGDRFAEAHSNSESVARAVLTYRRSRTLTFETGVEGAYNTLSSHTAFAVNDAPVALPAANVQVSETRGEAFVTATWQASAKLSIEAGLRVEASRISSAGDVVLEKTLTFPKPRLLATWSPTASDQFRFRVEREVGQLDFNDFVASSSLSTGQILAGNPDLNPQQAWVAEATYERRFWTDGAASITLRHSELTDVVDRVPIFGPSGPFDAPGNIGAGTKDELVGTVTLPLKRLGVPGGLLRADVTLRDSKVKDPETGRDRFISGLRPLVGGVHFSQDLPALKVKWGADVFLGFRERYYRLSQVETDTFKPILTLFAEWKVRPDLSLRGEVQELGTRFNRTLLSYPGVRGQVPLDTAEQRKLEYGPSLYFRVRKTF